MSSVGHFVNFLTTEMLHSLPPFHPWSLHMSCFLPLCVCVCVQDQFEQHVRANVKLNVYLYYGSERNRSKKFLSSQDVVITTYNVLSADFGVSVGRSVALR